MLTMLFSKRVSVPAHVLVRQVEGELVLLNLQNQRYFGLDEVGTRMWTVLTAAESVQTAYETLLAEYDVEADLLRQNLQELIEHLRANGLLEVVGG